ncbi:MAG: formylglycine-generating enzyme family protein, partial [Planctomycetota bacterium]
TGRYFWGKGPEVAGDFANGADIAAATLIGMEEKDAFPVRDAWPVTAPIGKRSPNAFGLWDTIGNAAEWVSDRFGSYPSDSVKDPTGPEKGSQIARGGSFAEGPLRCRAAFRQGLSDGRHPTVGFRVVATKPIEKR